MPSIKSIALGISLKDLRSCYEKEGIIAGSHHFTDYWARDGYFAALGSLAVGDTLVVEKMVKLFFRYQRQDGLIPYRIMRGPVTLGKYLGKPSFYDTPKATFRLRDIGNEVMDGATLTLLFTALLGLKNKLSNKKYIPDIKSALTYLSYREKNGLLSDGIMAEWNDTALKFGNLLYSNIIYWYMFNRLSLWVKSFDINWSKQLKLKENSVAKSLRNKLWNGKFFADWYDYKRQDFFYPFGNCLAIAWRLTDKKESELILRECLKIKVGFTLETNSPKYPWYRIDPFQRLTGMGDYQNQSLLWWQPATAYLAALKKTGRKKEANDFSAKMINKINKDNSVYECYERSGIPVNRFLYKSENPFAWSAGMIYWSLKK